MPEFEPATLGRVYSSQLVKEKNGSLKQASILREKE